MRFIVTVGLTGLLIVGCGKGADPVAPAPEAKAPDVATTPPRGAEAPPAAKAPEATGPAEPTPAKPEPVAKPAPGVVAPAARLTSDEMKDLEGRPGATPPLAQVEAPKLHAAEGLPGAPGAPAAAGPNDALAKVFVFSDFQCPVCRRAAEPLKHLVREFGDDVQIIFLHNALTSHRRAEPAALAAIAAQAQGKFWAFHDKVFEGFGALEDHDLEAAAEDAGLDVARFKADLASPDAAARVAYERALAEKLGARGTPGFFINGKRIVGWGSYFGVRALVARAIADGERRVAAGTPRERAAIEATAEAGDDGALFAKLVWGYTGK